MKVFVTGASGFVGRNLIPLLLRSGHSVSAWKGQEYSSLGFTAPNLSIAWGDLSDTQIDEKLEEAMDGCGAIVHLAAKTSEAPSSGDQSRSVNVDGTGKVVLMAEELKIKRFVFISSQSAKISTPGHYGASKKKGEDIVLNSGLGSVVLRPSLIYGPGEAGIFKKFVGIVESSPIIPIPYTTVKFQPVFVGDVTRAILASIEVLVFSRRVYDIAGTDPVTFAELIRKVAAAKKLSRFLLPIPMPLVILGARALALVMRNPPVTVDNLIGLTEATHLDLKPMVADLKVTPVSLEEGLQRSLGV